MLADGKHIEHRLCRMRVTPIPGIDNVNVRRHVASNEVGGAARPIPDDEHIGVHGLERSDRIKDRFAFGRRHSAGVQVNDIGRQALGGNLKRGLRAGTGLKKEIDHGAAMQQGYFSNLALTDTDKRFRGIQNFYDRLGVETIDSQQVAQLAVGVELNIRD